MIKIITTYLFYLLCVTTVVAQVNVKGITPNKKKDAEVATTKALIIGISNYKNEQIVDLQFAHKDALAFKAFLQSKTGGNLKDHQIKMFLNDTATLANFGLGFSTLLEETKKGDKAIIYFSGHGDMDANLTFHPGYLVPSDAVHGNYMGSAFSIAMLKEIVAQLIKKGVTVTAYFDACHSGNMATEKLAGTQISNAKLSEVFANETKIMSCQANEFSLEGKQWGGGRGCFSYHLVNGLMGMADINQDTVVSLLEIERYLQDWVSKDVQPHQQYPITVGNKTSILAKVDSQSLDDFQMDTSETIEQFASIRNKATLNQVTLSNSQKEKLDAFYKSLNQHPLIHTKTSSEYYFNHIIKDKTLGNHHATVKREFAIALIAEAQEYLNLLLAGSTDLIDAYTYNKEKNVQLLPDYLAKARAILGRKHYFYKNIEQKEFFFRAVALKETLLNGKFSKRQIKKRRQRIEKYYQKALAIDTSAAYVYLGLAQTYLEKNQFKLSLRHIDKAIYYAPKWTLATATKGLILSKSGQNKTAIDWLNKALNMDSTQLYPIQWQITNHKLMGDTDNANYWSTILWENISDLKKEAKQTPAYYEALLAIALSESGQYEAADSVFTIVFKKERKDAVLLHARALNYYWMGKKTVALMILNQQQKLRDFPNSMVLKALMEKETENPKVLLKKINKALVLMPEFAEAFWVKGQLLEKLGKLSTAEEMLWLAFEKQPLNSNYLKSLLSFFSNYQLEVEELKTRFEKMNQLNKNNALIHKEFALLFEEIGATDEAIKLVKKALLLAPVNNKSVN